MSTIRLAAAGAFCLLAVALVGSNVERASAQTPLSASRAAPEALWRSMVNLQPHRLGEEFEAFVASPPVQLKTATPSALTLPQAIANARARLSRDASSAAVAGLRSSPAARTVRGLQAAAMGAVIARKPFAALAAWLTAYDKEPRNRSVLVNLAGLLARLGMPAEALALLDAADTFGGALAVPAGLNGQAVALNSRGYALLLQRRWKEAEVVLRKALEQDPHLTEAARNLAYVMNQEGNQDEARKWFVQSAWRLRFQTLTTAGGTTATDGPSPDPFAKRTANSVPALGELFDLRYGVPGRLPMFRHPADLAQMDAFNKMIEKYQREVAARSVPRTTRLTEISALLRQRPHSLSEQRSAAILGAMSLVFAQPDVRELQRQEYDASAGFVRKGFDIAASEKTQIEAIYTRFTEQWRGKGPSDPGYAAALLARNRQIVAIGNDGIAQLTPSWNRLEEVVRKRLALRRRYMSAIVAQLGDPLWHERGTLFTLQDTERDFDAMLLLRIRSPVLGSHAPRACLCRDSRHRSKTTGHSPKTTVRHAVDRPR